MKLLFQHINWREKQNMASNLHHIFTQSAFITLYIPKTLSTPQPQCQVQIVDHLWGRSSLHLNQSVDLKPNHSSGLFCGRLDHFHFVLSLSPFVWDGSISVERVQWNAQFFIKSLSNHSIWQRFFLSLSGYDGDFQIFTFWFLLQFLLWIISFVWNFAITFYYKPCWKYACLSTQVH